MNMFCFDHFAAWMFLVDMLSDGLATTKYKEKCDVGELPCYFWWLSLTFMLLPTLGFVFTVLMLARKQTRDISQLIAYTFLAILYPILGASGIFVTCFNHFFGGENNKGQNLMMLPQFLFECIPQVRFLYFQLSKNFKIFNSNLFFPDYLNVNLLLLIWMALDNK